MANSVGDFEYDGEKYWDSFLEFELQENMYLEDDISSGLLSDEGVAYMNNYIEEYDPLSFAVVAYLDLEDFEQLGLITIALESASPAMDVEYDSDYRNMSLTSIKLFESLMNAQSDDLRVSISKKTLGESTYIVNKYSEVGSEDCNVRIEYMTGIGRDYYPCIIAMLKDESYQVYVDKLVASIKYKTRVDR